MDVLDLILKAFYLLLPGAVANMAPVFARGHLEFLNKPIDRGRTWRGKRILGDHKTWRGIIAALIGGWIVAHVQRYLYDFDVFQQISVLDYPQDSGWVIGGVMALGAMVGDAVKSFFKRQRGIAPGEKWIPWDKIDSLIGGLLFLMIIYVPPLDLFITILVLGTVLSLIVPVIGYVTKLRSESW